MARWRSSVVAVATIGAAGVTGCSRCDYYLRNLYANDTDCERDYSLVTCTRETHEGATYILGPWYRKDRRELPAQDPGPGATAVNGKSTLAVGVEEGRRAGFGSNGARTSACS